MFKVCLLYLCALPCVCMCPTCEQVTVEARRGYRIPWSWSYSGFEQPDMVAGTEPGSSVRAGNSVGA